MLTRALTAVGLPTTRAYELALRVEQDLATQGDSALELEHLEELARSIVGEEEAAHAVRKLRLYREFQRLDLPIVLHDRGRHRQRQVERRHRGRHTASGSRA